MLRIAVAYATLGRPDLICRTVDHLAGQHRRPDLVVISAVHPDDAVGAERCALQPELTFGSIGLCRQRNAALTNIGSRADLIVFLDDDFLPAADFLEQAEMLFEAQPNLVGATGRVIADGIKTPGYSFEDGLRFLAGDQPPQEARTAMSTALYGCNMILRADAIMGLQFDENLPFYGWLEDIDFTYRLGKRGPMISTNQLAGVHLGVKGGRTSGVKLGYSQIANPVYMIRKGSAPSQLAYRMMTRNLVSNVVRSFRPEPYVDRRGRLKGNLVALLDLLRGRIRPDRIIDFGKAK